MVLVSFPNPLALELYEWGGNLSREWFGKTSCLFPPFLPPPDCSIPKELPLSLTKRPHKKLWHRDFRGFDPFENGSAGESTGSNYLWLIILNSDFFYHRAIMGVGRPGSEQVL